MDLHSLLKSRMGVMTRVELSALGVTARHLSPHLAFGAIRAIGRRYIALPDARPELLRAAELGARVACVSAAALRGLWVTDASQLHLAVRANEPRVRAGEGLRLHWTTRRIDGADIAALESGRNMLLHVAQCQPIEDAVATFDSALNKGLISREELQRLASVHGGRFRKIVQMADGAADSGLESLTRVRLALRGVFCRSQVRIGGHRVDLLIGRWLVIQLDGWEHHRDRKQRDMDIAHDRTLVLQGYTVMRFGYTDVMERWPLVEGQILAAMAAGAHLRPGRH